LIRRVKTGVDYRRILRSFIFVTGDCHDVIANQLSAVAARLRCGVNRNGIN
jgi:hypothetical protein